MPLTEVETHMVGKPASLAFWFSPVLLWLPTARSFWSAVAKRSDDTAFGWRARPQKRRGAPLPVAVQEPAVRVLKLWIGLWLVAAFIGSAGANTVALWLFDEPEGLYPSSTLNDATGNGLVLALGRGGHIVAGRFGRALEPMEPAALKITGTVDEPEFGLETRRPPAGRTVAPMNWMNAHFCALMTRGERHLRSPGFVNPTQTKLNLGAFDWTVEFWYLPTGLGDPDGVVFEIGSGPRGENDLVTRLSLNTDRAAFTLENQPGAAKLVIPASREALAEGWHHLAFVYSAGERQLRHYVDGARQPLPEKAALQLLPPGDEAYFSIGRDGLWKRPLPGRLDELRFSDHQVYSAPFQPPGSFSVTYGKGLPRVALKAGPPLLFGTNENRTKPVELGSRKHLFMDDALVAEMNGITFTPQPPRKAEQVLDHVRGHLSLVEDEQGLLRLYYQGPEDHLAVMTSHDGIHWEKPDLGRGEFQGERNIVLPKPTSLGNVFIDPNAPPESRWKYVSDIRKQAIFVFGSADGWSFQPFEVAALPFPSGSQSIVYYDDQRQVYVGHHRSGYHETPGGQTERTAVLSQTTNLLGLWPWTRVTPEMTAEAAKRERIKADQLNPWFLDNGPLAPAGFSLELPTVYGPDEKLDPAGTDIYVTKVEKYRWAPDTYLAFPTVYCHYHGDGPPERQILGSPARNCGSGVTEVQLAVSRDGLGWKHYPQPAYVPIGSFGSNDVHMYFLTHGMIRRGNQIWQYVGGHAGNGIGYHSAWGQKGPWPLIRLVQRLDGFVAAEAAYTGGMLKTRPLKFQGNRLKLNLDTGAVGYAQVGLLDENGKLIPGFSVDECIYLNGDFIDTPVEWMKRGTDVSSLEGRTVQVVFRMRGTKLHAMQFAHE